jgi:hypothetical protein
VRLEVTFDKLEDLQVALGALLDCGAEDDELTIRVALEGTTSWTVSPSTALRSNAYSRRSPTASTTPSETTVRG